MKTDLESCDYRINTAGKITAVLLFVGDVRKVLGCSPSYAYQVIRECRGYPLTRGRAAVLPSVFRDYCIRKFGRPLDIPMKQVAVTTANGMTDDEALYYESERLKRIESIQEKREGTNKQSQDRAKPAASGPTRDGLRLTQPRTTPRGGR